MGILTRIFNLFRATTSDLLDKAEDPEKMIKQMISDLEAQKKKAKEQMTEALALQKRLERDTKKEHQEAEKWEQKAILAVQNEKDDLAKEALTRKNEHLRRAIDFEKQLEMHQESQRFTAAGEVDHLLLFTQPSVQDQLKKFHETLESSDLESH